LQLFAVGERVVVVPQGSCGLTEQAREVAQRAPRGPEDDAGARGEEHPGGSLRQRFVEPLGQRSVLEQDTRFAACHQAEAPRASHRHLQQALFGLLGAPEGRQGATPSPLRP
jgi:hypothetical protein